MKKKHYWLSIIIILLLIASFVAVKQIKAGTAESGRGWLWGGTEDGSGNNSGVGWISLNSENPPLGSVSYGVDIPTNDGNLSGYAWSENIGWISFNQADLAGCPDGNCVAKRTGNNLEGWARIIGIRDEAAVNNSGGWQGWIKLKDTITQNQWQCPSSGKNYFDQASCESACTQTASCASASGKINIGNGNGSYVTFKPKSDGTGIEDNRGGRIDISGTCRISGPETTKGLFSCDYNYCHTYRGRFEVDANGTSIKVIRRTFLSGGESPYVDDTLAVWNVSGCKIRGTMGLRSDTAIQGSGNSIVNTVPRYGGLEFLSPTLSPICATLQSCIIQNSSTIDYGVQIADNPATTDKIELTGYAWSDELGWIDFSQANIYQCVSSTYTYSCVNDSCSANAPCGSTASWSCVKTDNCGVLSPASQNECTTNGVTCSGVQCNDNCPTMSGNWREVPPN